MIGYVLPSPLTTQIANGTISAHKLIEGLSIMVMDEAQKLEAKLPTDKLYAMELSGVHVRKSLKLTWFDGRERELEFIDVYRITHNKLGTVKIMGTQRLHGGEYSRTFPANAEVEIL